MNKSYHDSTPTPDIFWKKFKPILVTNQAGRVTYSEYSSDGRLIVITASNQIKLLDVNHLSWIGKTKKFSNLVYSASFRRDCKLIVVGGENSVVQVFDVTTLKPLRNFHGHTRPVHCTRFSIDNIHILSTSDDSTICTWDISRGSLVSRLTGHTDFVRTASNSPTNSSVWLTGCYDHTVRLWDVRANSCGLTMDHGVAVEEVRILSSGTLCVSLGKSTTRIWDLRTGGKMLTEFKNSGKSSSCLCVTSGVAGYPTPQLVIGGLDGNVKIHEMGLFKISYRWKYHFPVLTLGVSPDLCSIAVGMADGTFCLRKFSGRTPSSVHTITPSQSVNIRRKNDGLEISLCVVSNSGLRHKNFNFQFKLSRYSDTIGAALSSCSPDVVMAIIEEYINRGILRTVITGCKFAYIASILDFLSNYLNTPSYTRPLIKVLTLCLDIRAFEISQDKYLTKKLTYLNHVVSKGEFL